jgi:hypothetical protein
LLASRPGWQYAARRCRFLVVAVIRFPARATAQVEMVLHG